jgi:uncharacterized protein YjbJ (UPF0337 family)
MRAQKRPEHFRPLSFSSPRFPETGATERSARAIIDSTIPNAKKEEQTMDKDRIEGSAEQAKGKVKETIGKVTGDAKLQGEGKGDQIAGKTKNAIGGAKDAAKEAVDELQDK